MAAENPGRIGLADVVRWYAAVLAPDAAFIRLALVYGLAISLVSLATPISVQLLINSVANTALATPLFTLAGLLFALLLVACTADAMSEEVNRMLSEGFDAVVSKPLTPSKLAGALTEVVGLARANLRPPADPAKAYG